MSGVERPERFSALSDLAAAIWCVLGGAAVCTTLALANVVRLGGPDAAGAVLAFVLLTLAVVGTVFLWRQKYSDPGQQKAKRGRINTLLRDLSDEEILELKHRLSLADFSDQPPLSALDEDGELVDGSGQRKSPRSSNTMKLDH